MNKIATDKKVDFILQDNTKVFKQEVLHSAAGYYVGRLCEDPEFGFIAPYCRDSEYDTKEGAEKLLKYWWLQDMDEGDMDEDDIPYKYIQDDIPF